MNLSLVGDTCDLAQLTKCTQGKKFEKVWIRVSDAPSLERMIVNKNAFGD